MAILRVFSKEVIQNLRNVRAMTYLVLFPIILILVLGTALSGAFDKSSEFKNVNILYTSPSNNPLGNAFEGFTKKGEEMGFTFKKVQSPQQALDLVKNENYVCFININDNGLEIYENDKQSFKAQLVEGVLGAFLQRYKAITQIAQVKPGAVAEIVQDQSDPNFTKLVTLGEKRQPQAIDYYAVTMLTLIILYSSMTGAHGIKDEITAKTMKRLLCAPIKKYEVLTGKTLGCLTITLLQVLIVILVTKFLLKTYWGNHLGVIFLVLASEVVMAVTLGIGVSFIARNERGILNILIPSMAFFGGNYMPIEDFGKVMLVISNYSPIRWINKALFSVIYSNDYSYVAQAIIINLGIAAIFLAISAVSFRREVI